MFRKYSFLFLGILLVGCFGARDLSNENLSSVYRSSEQVFHPEFNVYQLSDSVARITIRILPSEFLFVRQPDDLFKAFLKLETRLVESYESPAIMDSVTLFESIDMMEKGGTKQITFDFKSKAKGSFLLNFLVTDQNKNYQEDFFVNFDNSDSLNRQCFLVTSGNNETVFRNYITAGDTIHLHYRDSATKYLWCKYYHRDFGLAPPPFSFDVREDFNYHADSSFRVDLTDTSGLTLTAEGFYHFQADSNSKSGLTLFRFNGGFPAITTPQQMFHAMRYLTTKREFEDIQSKPNLKAGMDAFWLDRGGNAERTRLLIRKYYTRVQEANKYFTSFTEGWRTDRGMLYIIFGSPNTIYRSALSESWIYGTPNSNLSLNFFFVKVNNPFSDNDFTLSRSPIYEGSWYRAVEVWRQGRAYNSMN
ncbi:MAG TPA: GWxTD domain-containing protein [Bacteroidia bacterium]|nr:GWxTD domain-containing protein [Bacteroidia bacterium]